LDQKVFAQWDKEGRTSQGEGEENGDLSSRRMGNGTEEGNQDLPQSDWSPLTVYAVARNGDTYAICPFMPAHA